MKMLEISKQMRNESEKIMNDTICEMPTKTATSFAVHPVLQCLDLFDQTFCDGERNWNPINDQQRLSADLLLWHGAEPDKIKESLDAIADLDIAKVNRWLAERGFTIKASEDMQDTFAVASVLNLPIKWENDGIESTIHKDGKTYPAAKMKKGFEIFEKDGLKFLKIVNENSDYKKDDDWARTDVYMVECENNFKDELDMLQFVRKYNHSTSSPHGYRNKIIDRLGRTNQNFTPIPPSPYYSAVSVTFPKINYHNVSSLDFLCGMSIDVSGKSFPHRIALALQENFFKMDHLGAEVKSGTLMMGYSGYNPLTNEFIIDKPFLLWVERTDMELPVFIGYFDEKYWKE